ncbi:hypothetical protein KC353_g18054 [Hortaea werneckii]|uniref:Cytoplasmic tRNA 2-thiolation protein 2 n=1 Tax=Hortaea werneckii TaxID=91943 RepID=A0A3M7CEV8_HORWE|nr:hypothetical protein KC353_g18054 [Hortaea werneckii]RMY50668.1 hypothetical protein D0865_06767 [Hortaea werneckii]
MPGRRTPAVPLDPTLCRRCQAEKPSINVRTEPLCTGCFSKYVSTKVVKRMESFRVRHSDPGKQRTLLLPLSHGPCSTALLHLLHQHLQGQTEKTGRTGFKLHVLHIKNLEEDDNDDSLLNKVRERYPTHAFTAIPLADVLSCEGLPELLQHDTSSSRNENGNEAITGKTQLEKLFASLTSPTSKDDIQNILTRKLVVTFATQNSCEAILWGDSTTHLAERTLSETAKGRGSSLPWIVADGDALHGIPFYFPLRDLLSKEIASFATLIQPPLDDLIQTAPSKPAVSTKNTTIDDLMRQYFESVEQEYPSIVANVVKTTSKLQTVPLDEIEAQCELCDVPLDAAAAPARSRLCYGCIRTLPGVA